MHSYHCRRWWYRGEGLPRSPTSLYPAPRANPRSEGELSNDDAAAMTTSTLLVEDRLCRRQCRGSASVPVNVWCTHCSQSSQSPCNPRSPCKGLLHGAAVVAPAALCPLSAPATIPADGLRQSVVIRKHMPYLAPMRWRPDPSVGDDRLFPYKVQLYFKGRGPTR
jgi:hypothetical protein